MIFLPLEYMMILSRYKILESFELCGNPCSLEVCVGNPCTLKSCCRLQVIINYALTIDRNLYVVVRSESVLMIIEVVFLIVRFFVEDHGMLGVQIWCP